MIKEHECTLKMFVHKSLWHVLPSYVTGAHTPSISTTALIEVLLMIVNNEFLAMTVLLPTTPCPFVHCRNEMGVVMLSSRTTAI